MSAAEQHERLRALNARQAPPYERLQAFQDWFRASVAEGNPPDRLRRDAPTWSERFDAYVVEGLDGCLIWDGPTELRATGRVPVIHKGGKKRNARLYAMQRAGLTVPAQRRVVPDCGNPRCVRLEHLVIEDAHWSASWTREEMLKRVRVMALRLGHTPHSRQWAAEKGRPSLATFRREFASWDEVIEAAGLPPAFRERTNQYTNVDWEQACARGLLALARKLNRPPFVTDIVREAEWLKTHGHPVSRNTYYRYLSGEGRMTWAKVLARVGLRGIE